MTDNNNNKSWEGNRRRQTDELADNIKAVQQDIHSIKHDIHKELTEINTFFVQCQMNKDYVQQALHESKAVTKTCCERINELEKQDVDLKRRVMMTEKFSWGLLLAVIPTMVGIVISFLR